MSEAFMQEVEEYNSYFLKVMEFGIDDIKEELIKVAGEYAYFSSKYSDANRRWLFAKANRQSIEAKREIILRQELIQRNGKTTESQVTSAIRTDREYQDCLEREIIAEADREHLKNCCDGCKLKKDVLISTSAMQREEMKGDPILRA